MKHLKVHTRFLIVAGNILVWLPILLPIIFSFVMFFIRGRFMFDFLMPAELFLVYLPGAIFLIWAAIRKKEYKKPIITSFVIGLLALILSQVVAVVTGLANGETKPEGWPLILVISIYAFYPLSIIVTGIEGIRLIREN